MHTNTETTALTPQTALAAHPALRLLGEPERRALLRWSVIRTLQRQELAFRRGDTARSVLLVLEGCLKLATVCDGREVVLEVVGPGCSAGEVSLLNRWPLRVDAVALTRTRVLSLDGRQFVQALERAPAGQAAMMRLVSQRLRGATDRMAEALALSGPARLAKALLQIAAFQPPGVPLPVSQSDLGAMAGITRESVNKSLAAWRDAGWVALSGGCIARVDAAALAELLRDRMAA
jgi:CRP-like cAMP-binding protein